MHAFGSVPLPPLDEHSLLVFWCQVLAVLFVARAGGYAMRRLGQPRVIGELLAGVALGPSLLGRVWPGGFDWMFPASERQSGLLLGLAWVGIVFLLGITGAEIEMSTIRHRGRAAAAATVGSLTIPLAAGALVAALVPASLLGSEATRPVFVAFFAVAFAISSLPVAARILGDLGMATSPVAQLALGVATANDVVGWLLLGVVVGISEAGTFALRPLAVALVVVIAVSGVVIQFGGRALNLVAGAVARRDGGPAAEASLIALTLIGIGTITHAVGIEVVIGAFVAGIAIGASRLADTEGFRAVEIVTNGVFAPLFFAIAGSSCRSVRTRLPHGRLLERGGDPGGQRGQGRRLVRGGPDRTPEPAGVTRSRHHPERPRGARDRDRNRGTVARRDRYDCLHDHRGHGAGDHGDDRAGAETNVCRRSRPGGRTARLSLASGEFGERHVHSGS